MAWVRSKLRSRAMRSSVGGCVEKRLAKLTLRPLSGLMMYAVASAGFTSIGVRLAAASIFWRARASGSPSPVRCAPDASAWYSRERDSAIWSSPAAIGASMAIASSPKMLPPSLSPPPKIALNIAIRATNVIINATAAATDPMRMSRLRTCESSWAISPREVLDDLVEPGRLFAADGLGPGGGDGDLVAEPVRAADDGEGQHGADD